MLIHFPNITRNKGLNELSQKQEATSNN